MNVLKLVQEGGLEPPQQQAQRLPDIPILVLPENHDLSVNFQPALEGHIASIYEESPSRPSGLIFKLVEMTGFEPAHVVT